VIHLHVPQMQPLRYNPACTTMQTVGIISKPRKEDVSAVVPQLLAWLRARGLEVLYDCETAACISGEIAGIPRQDLARRVDLLVVLGGDGTLLATARAAGDHIVPILPVNLGGLGFLTSVTLDELYSILELALKGKHRTSERMLLEAEILRRGKPVEPHRALNDAVLNKGTVARMIEFDLRIDGTYVSTFRADGLIISTPTGSTAYSLSAGGPIVYPVLDAFVITPICPHMLTLRPLVIPDSMKIEVDFRAGEEPAVLTLDGQVAFELEPDDRIVVRKSPARLRLVRPARKTYYEILRSKLKWATR
jgi:NAD+ kinase